MQEPYKQGVANQLDPESCDGGRKDAGEALTGAHAGQPLSSEITSIGVPTSYDEGEGHRETGVIGKPAAHAAESETLSMRENSMRENRETPAMSLAVGVKDRPEKASSHTSGVNVAGESDDPIVPTKRANKVGP
jgi:RNA-directed DNA polymerase